MVTGDYYGQISIFNLSFSSLSPINIFKAHSDGFVYRIKQSPFIQSRNFVATCSETVKIWDSSSPFNWTLIRTYSNQSVVYDMEWLDEDTVISCGCVLETIKIWSISTGQTKKTIQNVPKDEYVSVLKLLSNKIHLAVGCDYYPTINKHFQYKRWKFSFNSSRTCNMD